MSTSTTLRDLPRTLEHLTPTQTATLDRWSEQLQGGLHQLVNQGGPAAVRVKSWLNGTWLGHPLHPALTDVALGALWTGALLDVTGPRRAADTALAVGVLAAAPTAASGAADWADTAGEQRRHGLLHAALNSFGLACVIGSLLARRADHRALGVGLSTAGLTAVSASAWIGGELVYRSGTGVNRNAWLPAVDEFRSVLDASALEPGKPVGAEVELEGERVPIVLVQKGARVLALGGTCSHAGGPLAEGQLVNGDCVECPWHGSLFDMQDGRVVQGPASVPQLVFEARIRDGRVEVRTQR